MSPTDEPVLQHMLDRYAAAVRERDAEALLALYCDDVLVFDAWDRWAYRGKLEWAAAVAAWFGAPSSETLEVEFPEMTCAILGGSASACGIVRYRAVDRNGGTIHAIENRITWVLRARGDDWAIVHEHTSLPVGFESKLAVPAGDAVA